MSMLTYLKIINTSISKTMCVNDKEYEMQAG
jgi:hypothetical protein